MMLPASTGLSITSVELPPSETPNEDQPRVPTMTIPSGSFARMTGMTCSA